MSAQLEKLHTQFRQYEEQAHNAVNDGNAVNMAPTTRLALATRYRNNTAVTENHIDIDALIAEVKGEALITRAHTLADYIGTTDVEKNTAKLRQHFVSLTRNKEGKIIPIKDFEKKIHHAFGEVLTGHPVFNMSRETSGALARCFTEIAKGTDPAEMARLETALVQTLETPFKPLTLDEENAHSIDILHNCHDGMDLANQIAISVGQEVYPTEWKTINYSVGTVATWIPFDWDGRNDVTWQDLMEKTMILKSQMLDRYTKKLDVLAGMVDTNDQTKIHALKEQVAHTKTVMDTYAQRFKSYNQKQDPHGTTLAGLSQDFVKDTVQTITHPSTLIEPLQEILSAAQGAAEPLIVLMRSNLASSGISLAHRHFRINGKSVLSALAEHIQIDPNMENKYLDDAYGPDVEDLVTKAFPRTSHLGDTASATETIAKQMTVIRQIVDHIDSHAPNRFLIAENHSAVLPMTALYFAKSFGVDKHIDICPLFEDREGTDNADNVTEYLLNNSDFSAHISEERPHALELHRTFAIQLGYSDSGRYDGQFSAGYFAHRVKKDALELLHEKNIPNVSFTVFDTHGESMGRGAHAQSVSSRLAYIQNPVLITKAKDLHIGLHEEESFQGGDGFLPHGTPEASFAYLVQAIAHQTGYYPKSRKDVMHVQKSRAQAFFERVRHAHATLLTDPGYTTLVNMFVPMSPVTGSRPIKRAEESGGKRELPRAIQHNGAFHQLMMLSTVVSAVAQGVKEKKSTFDDLIQNSKEFRRRFTQVLRAMDVSDMSVLRSYVGLYKPAFWEEQARNEKDPVRLAQINQVKQAVEELGYYGAIRSVVSRLDTDFQSLQKIRADLDLPNDPMKNSDYAQKINRQRDNMHVLHGIRQAEMMDLFLLATTIPGVSGRQDVNRAQMIQKIIRLDGVAIDELGQIFDVKKENGNGFLSNDFGKVSELQSIVTDYSGLHERTVKPLQEKIAHIKDIGQANMYYLGVG